VIRYKFLESTNYEIRSDVSKLVEQFYEIRSEIYFNFNIWITREFNGVFGRNDGGWTVPGPRDVYEQPHYYIDFETEEDLLLFKLKTGL
jgi:hypothetical protein